jgi:hypothetical protein
MLLKKIMNNIADRWIHMQTMDSNTLCTTDLEQRKLVTLGLVWMVEATFVLWTVRSDFLKNI